jgi:hypothetical protein
MKNVQDWGAVGVSALLRERRFVGEHSPGSTSK